MSEQRGRRKPPARAEDGSLVKYRDVERFACYRVGSDGSVWSNWRDPDHRWHRLKARYNGKSDVPGRKWQQLIVSLQTARGERCWRLVSNLVLEAFVGPRPRKTFAIHKDGNLANNRLDNLHWGARNGCTRIGVQKRNAKLNDEKVLAIRAMHAQGMTKAEIARRLGVSAMTIYSVVTGRTWKHVKGEVPSAATSP